MSARHLAKVLDWRSAYCGAVMTEDDTLPTSNPDAVECKACLAIMAEAGVFTSTLVHFIPTVQWGGSSSAPYLCGAGPSNASSNRDDVTCPGCQKLMGRDRIIPLTLTEYNRVIGGGTSTPQVPPRMEDERGIVDGAFTFFDVHLGEYYTMEVVPQLSGNVEITLTHEDEGTPEDGRLFTLSHLDRANLLRALLHEFHYSPERGGPNDND